MGEHNNNKQVDRYNISMVGDFDKTRWCMLDNIKNRPMMPKRVEEKLFSFI